MIFFLYGGDTYRSTQKLNQIKQRYISSLGDVNLTVMEDDFDLPQMTGEILAMPFLSEKRLIVIKNFVKKAKKEVGEGLIKILDQMPESSVLVFWEEGDPDKRLNITKRLLKEKCQPFNLLLGAELSQWIKKEVSELSGTIENEAANLLCAFVGNNLWQLNQEIQKLANFDKKITIENIKLLVNAKVNANIFEFSDAIGAQNPKKAVQSLHALLDSGEPEAYILIMITRQIRNILLVKELKESGKHQTEIAKELGIHPFVVSKTLPQCNNFTFSDLKEIYQALLECDIAIKTGQIGGVLALDLLVQKIIKPLVRPKMAAL